MQKVPVLLVGWSHKYQEVLDFFELGQYAIDFSDLTEAVPAYLCLLAMPMVYSISEGIAIGVISYVLINLICGKRKKITPLMYVLAVLFVCKYIFL